MASTLPTLGKPAAIQTELNFQSSTAAQNTEPALTYMDFTNSMTLTQGEPCPVLKFRASAIADTGKAGTLSGILNRAQRGLKPV